MQTLYESKPLSDFPPQIIQGVISALQPLINGSEIKDIYIYGSYMRTLFTGDAFGDIDIALATKSERRAILEKINDRHLQQPGVNQQQRYFNKYHISRHCYASKYSLLDSMDLSIAQLIYSHSDTSITYRPDYFELVCEKYVRINRLPVTFPSGALCWSYKYIMKGYKWNAHDIDAIMKQLLPYHRSSLRKILQHKRRKNIFVEEIE